MRIVLTLLALCLVTLPARAEERGPAHPPGGCESYSWDMNRELQLVGAFPIAITAHRDPNEEGRWTPLDRHLDTQLRPMAEVSLMATPHGEHGTGGFGGLIPLELPRQDIYRISTDQHLWIDVIGPDGLVEASKFEMRPGCEKLIKSVAFKLLPGVQYWVQLSGSSSPQATVMITLDR